MRNIIIGQYVDLGVINTYGAVTARYNYVTGQCTLELPDCYGTSVVEISRQLYRTIERELGPATPIFR